VGAPPKSPVLPFSREREGLSALLQSGEFSRSPNLEKILIYLCEKCFVGESASIKEYHLATEVLGRPESFDPKRDSIVRVELHRLRRRLREAAAKAPPEAVRVLLPEKSYTPQFVMPAMMPTLMPADAEPAEPELVDAEPVEIVALEPIVPAMLATETLPAVVVEPPAAPPAQPRGKFWLVAAAALLGLITAALWWVTRETSAPTAAATATSLTAEPVAALPVGDQIRILAGRPNTRHVDSAGRVWEGDRFFKGGEAVASQGDVRTGGYDPDLFSGFREGEFEYNIPLKPGVYEVTFLFAETQYGDNGPMGGGEGYRIFSIEANGRRLASEVDVMAQTMDNHTAAARRFRGLEPAKDGLLHLKFVSNGSGKPFVNAIVVEPGLAKSARPLRIICRAKGQRDAKQVSWEHDHFYRGGVQITRPHGAPIENGDVFRGERYGRFHYSIPVPAGRYTAKLYFWEYWWGPNNPGKGGEGSRLFDVFANHRALLTDFDIIRTNPASQHTVQTFRGLEPDARGQIVLDFIPKRNYAMVNAIEILDEAQ
jgi:hypothetical protein